MGTPRVSGSQKAKSMRQSQGLCSAVKTEDSAREEEKEADKRSSQAHKFTVVTAAMEEFGCWTKL